MILQDGPLEGYEINDPGLCAFISIPEVDGDGSHFIDHTYTPDGYWQHSETRVGYESDETIARREYWNDYFYWQDVESASEDSFV